MNKACQYFTRFLDLTARKRAHILVVLFSLLFIHANVCSAYSRSENRPNQVSSVQARPNPGQVAPTPDSQRLSKKIFPVIRKSFNRYPSYYLYIFLAGFVIFAAIRLIEPSYLKFLLASTINLNLLLNLFK